MSQSYQIPTEKEKDNKVPLQVRRSDSVSVTMVSATPPNSAAKPIQQLPASTLSHLENIFEAVKKQVSIWGERARWKIDLVLLPAEDEEDTENSNQVVGGSSNQQQSGLHTPTSDNAGDTPVSAHGRLQLTTISTQTQPPQVQFYTQAENVRVENPMRYYTLDDDTIEKLDIETAKRMLKEAILHIRAYESTLNRVSRESETKIKEAQARAKKANEQIESMAKFHSIREKEKTSKHSVELKILQEDVKILSRKYKEANAQLTDVKAKYASFQEQVIRSKEVQSKTTDMVGKIVEYIPQQQTNGYLTYNFPYVQKMLPQRNPQQYLQQNQPPQQLNPTLPSSSSPSVQYSNGRPVIPPAYTSQQVPNRRNFPPYQTTQTIQNNSSRYPTYPSNQLHSENNRPVFSPYSFPQHHQPPQDIRQTQSATYPIQMNTLPASTQPRVVPAYTHIQQNVPDTPTIETSISTYVPVQRSERSGLDNLSLAAELILSSAIPSSTSISKQDGQQIISNSTPKKNSSREVSSSSDCSTISMETPINVASTSAASTSLVETHINIKQTNGMSTPSKPPPRFNTRLVNSSKNISTPDTITVIADGDIGYQSTPIYADGHSIHTLSPSMEVYEDNHSSSGDETDEFIHGEGNHQVLEKSKSDVKSDLTTESINVDVTSNHHKEESEEESNGPPKKKRRLSNVKRVPPPVVQIF